MNQTDQYHLIIVHKMEKHFLIKTRVYKLFRNYHLTFNGKNWSSPSKATGLSKNSLPLRRVRAELSKTACSSFWYRWSEWSQSPTHCLPSGHCHFLLCFSVNSARLPGRDWNIWIIPNHPGCSGRNRCMGRCLRVNIYLADIETKQMNWRPFNQEAAFSANNIILSTVSSWDKLWTC